MVVEDPSDMADMADKDESSSEFETDAVILARREKQIEYGRNTVAYDKYLEAYPKEQRNPGMPRTPDKDRKYR